MMFKPGNRVRLEGWPSNHYLLIESVEYDPLDPPGRCTVEGVRYRPGAAIFYCAGRWYLDDHRWEIYTGPHHPRDVEEHEDMTKEEETDVCGEHLKVGDRVRLSDWDKGVYFLIRSVDQSEDPNWVNGPTFYPGGEPEYDDYWYRDDAWVLYDGPLHPGDRDLKVGDRVRLSDWDEGVYFLIQFVDQSEHHPGDPNWMSGTTFHPGGKPECNDYWYRDDPRWVLYDGPLHPGDLRVGDRVRLSDWNEGVYFLIQSGDPSCQRILGVTFRPGQSPEDDHWYREDSRWVLYDGPLHPGDPNAVIVTESRRCLEEDVDALNKAILGDYLYDSTSLAIHWLQIRAVLEKNELI